MNAAVRLVRLLRGKGLTVTTAESMTGGLIAGAITSVPGASEVLSLALCTYSNEAKRRFLGVSASTIAAHTEISAPCAREMARGAAALAGADLALSVTGLAGAKTRRTPFAKSSPDDGTVFIGVLLPRGRAGVPLPLCGHARGNPPEGRSGGAGAGLPRRGKGMRRRRFRRAGQTNRKGAVMWRTALSAGIAEN